MTTALADPEIAQYRDQGYLHVPSLLSEAELARLQAVTAKWIALATSTMVPHRHFSYRVNPATGEPVFYRIDFPKVRSLEFQALMGHPGLLGVFERLIGPNFIAIDDSLVVKLPGSGVDFGWHRDTAGTLPRAGYSVAVPGIDLDPSTIGNGCVHVVPGSNRLDVVDVPALVAEHGFNLPGAVPMESGPGDLLVHSANCLHGSKPNETGPMRRTIYVGAMDIDDYLTTYQAPPELVRLQMRFMLRGVQLRQRLDYTRGEEPYEWKGDPQWRVDLAEDDPVEWDLPAHAPTT
jgi:hypothetical protein